jgi:hypothetical protein
MAEPGSPLSGRKTVKSDIEEAVSPSPLAAASDEVQISTIRKAPNSWHKVRTMLLTRFEPPPSPSPDVDTFR